MGRRGEMTAFRENPGRDPEADDYQFFFHVHGDAGVGETSLPRQVRVGCGAREIALRVVTERQERPVDVQEEQRAGLGAGHDSTLARDPAPREPPPVDSPLEVRGGR